LTLSEVGTRNVEQAVDGGAMATTADRISRFELAPPRRFILPAVLLLLSEHPGYGYALVPRLQEFHFGHVDRPAVYRALAQLEKDGLVETSASPRDASVAQARRVYHVTEQGERVLREWMRVIKEEHDHLGQVVRRYQATGTADAMLAEVGGGWAAALEVGWSPVSSTSATHRRLGSVGVAVDEPATPVSPSAPEARSEHRPEDPPVRRRFRLLEDRSVVLIEVRSTVGPISFGAIGVTGWIEAALADEVLRTDSPPAAHLEVDLSGLRSGNSLYDAELLRRIDARRFPTATIDLQSCDAGSGPRYQLGGTVTFHGVTRSAQGTISAEVTDHRLVVTGEQVFDIRDFAIPSPTVLMLRIFPDVLVRLHAEAEEEEEER
jgi:DNA-binding PadR family transcriptional regulator